MPCNVFEGEKLTYLFVGRPAYEYEMDPGETQEWLLGLLPVSWTPRLGVS